MPLRSDKNGPNLVKNGVISQGPTALRPPSVKISSWSWAQETRSVTSALNLQTPLNFWISDSSNQNRSINKRKLTRSKRAEARSLVVYAKDNTSQRSVTTRTNCSVWLPTPTLAAQMMTSEPVQTQLPHLCPRRAINMFPHPCGQAPAEQVNQCGEPDLAMIYQHCALQISQKTPARTICVSSLVTLVMLCAYTSVEIAKLVLERALRLSVLIIRLMHKKRWRKCMEEVMIISFWMSSGVVSCLITKWNTFTYGCV